MAPGGRRYSGTVQLSLPGRTLAGTVEELDDGWFRLLTWKDGHGTVGVWAWLATYGEDAAPVGEFGERAQQALERLFPGNPASAA